MNLMQINGVEVDISKLDLKKLKEDQRMSIIKFQNKLLERQWLEKDEIDKYWSDSKRDIFEIKDYRVDLREDILDEWDDLAYLIRRSRIQQVKEECKMNQKFTKRTKFRENGDSVLHICAEFNQVELFTWFIEEYKCDINAVNEAKETPLIIAAREGKIDIVKLIMDEYKHTEDFNVDHKMADGWTALMYASMNGFISIVDLLHKDGGADINTVDRLHRSCLHWSCRFNNLKIIQKLLEDFKIKYETTDMEMQTPADIAMRYKNFDAEKMIRTFDKKRKMESEKKKKLRKENEKKQKD